MVILYLKSIITTYERIKYLYICSATSSKNITTNGIMITKILDTVEESKYGSGRKIKLVKVKGSYGTYLVETKFLTEGEKDLLLMAGFLIVMAILF